MSAEESRVHLRAERQKRRQEREEAARTRRQQRENERAQRQHDLDANLDRGQPQPVPDNLSPHELALLHIDRREQETDESLERSIRMAREAQTVGAETMTTLHGQREQMNRIRDDVHEVDATMDRTNHVLKGMKHFWGNMFRKKPTPKKKPNHELRDAPEPYQRPVSAPAASQQQQQHTEQYAVQTESSERAQRQDRQLDELHGLVQGLHVMAGDMNGELAVQSNILDGLNDDIDRVDCKITNQTKRIRQLT